MVTTRSVLPSVHLIDRQTDGEVGTACADTASLGDGTSSPSPQPSPWHCSAPAGSPERGHPPEGCGSGCSAGGSRLCGHRAQLPAPPCASWPGAGAVPVGVAPSCEPAPQSGADEAECGGGTLMALVLARQAEAGSESGRPAPPAWRCTPTGGARPGTRPPRWVSGRGAWVRGARGRGHPHAPTAGPACSAVLGGSRSTLGAPEGPGEEEEAPGAPRRAGRVLVGPRVPPQPQSLSPGPRRCPGRPGCRRHPSSGPSSRWGFTVTQSVLATRVSRRPLCPFAERHFGGDRGRAWHVRLRAGHPAASLPWLCWTIANAPAPRARQASGPRVALMPGALGSVRLRRGTQTRWCPCPPPCLPRGWHLLAASVRARRASARGCGLCPWGQRPRASHARRPARLAGPLTTVFGTAPCASRHCARLLPRRPRPPPTARRGRVRLAKRPRPPASVRPAQTPGHRISLNP